MSRRMKLQELEDERVAAARALAVKQEVANAIAAAATAATPVAPTAQNRNGVSAIPNIKTERAHAAVAAAEPIQDMQALSIDEEQSENVQMPPPPQTRQPALTAPEPSAFQTQPQPPSFVKPEPTPSVPVAPPVAPVAVQANHKTASIKREYQPPVPSVTQQPTATAASNNSAVVDLTEDDDEFDAPAGLSVGIRNVKCEPFSSTAIFGNPHSVPVAATRPGDEPVVKRESSAWLAAATALTGSSAGDGSGDASLAEDMDDDLFSLTDGDPIMRTMISEYNRLSEVIFNHEQEIAAIQKQIKDMLADQAADMNAVVQCSNTAAQVKNSVVKETHNRNAVVARLVVYLKQDPTELKALLDESQATDIPHMQTASHRRCAQLEALIREKRYTIRKLKRSMEDAINMKSQDAFAEVSRLGAMIVADEQAVKESEEDRVVEFIRLFQFSKQIRNAARNMVSSSAP